MLFGRIWFKAGTDFKFKYILIMIFFIIGFLIGNFITGYGKPIFIVLIYLIGIVSGYSINKSGFIKSVDF